MERCETRKTNEVRNIQRENVADPVHVHRGSQACVMHLDAQDAVLSHDSSPLSINGLAICQQAHTCLNGLNFSFGLTHAQPKAVAINRAGHYVPEFCNILVSVVESCALFGEQGERICDNLVLRVGLAK